MRPADDSQMDSLPPPPYTEVADASNATTQPVQANLRGGYMRPLLLSDQNNVSSANTYFGDRGDPNLYRGGVHLSSIEFPITFSGETVREDLAFPHPIETYLARDVTSLDWSTFVNFLFPMHNAARNGKLRQEQDPQHHSFIGEDTPARRDRILAVIAEWNESFFNPRRIHIKAHFSPLPSYPSSRSTVITPAVQSQHVGSQPFQPAPPTMYRDSPAHWSANLSATQPIHRSLSASSSGSSSSSSVDSIKSKDLEGVGLGQIRSAMLAFQLDATKKDHLRASVRQLRDDFRSQRQSLSGKDGKELKKESRNQRKEIKNEIKAAMKEVKAMRKVDRKIRKAERKCQGQSRRIEHRSNDRMKTYEDRGGRAEERAAERVRGAQERGREVEGRAEERAARAHYRAKEAQARGATAVARAQERVAVARARGWDSEARATQPRQELNARNGAAQQENVTRSHKQNDRDHAGLADGTAEEIQHLPRYFAKAGHVDADPKKVKKEGGGKGNWGTPGDESQDYGYNFTNARRRSNSSSHGHAISDFKTKFEAVEADPVFEEEYHGAKDYAGVDKQLGLEKGDSTDSISGGSIEEEEHAKKV